jgi:hypothetical protein
MVTRLELVVPVVVGLAIVGCIKRSEEPVAQMETKPIPNAESQSRKQPPLAPNAQFPSVTTPTTTPSAANCPQHEKRQPPVAPALLDGKRGVPVDPAASSQAGELPSEASDIRRWNDASGKFSIDAEFMGVKDGNVRLRKKDGRIISVPIERLSASDQLVVKNQVKTIGNEGAARPPVSAAHSLEELEHTFKVTGSLRQGLAAATGFEFSFRESKQTTTTYLQRRLRLQLTNTGNVPIDLGDDLVLVEADSTKSKVAGMLVLMKEVEPSGVLSRRFAQPQRSFGIPDFDERYADYHSYPNCVGGSTEACLYLNSLEVRRELIDDSIPRSIPPNATRFLRLTLNQGQFLAIGTAASVRVALPEIRIAANGGTAKYRLTIHFAKNAGAQRAGQKDGMINQEEWTVANGECFKISGGDLTGVLANAGAD